MKQLFISLLFASLASIISAQTIVESNEGTVAFIVDSIFGNMDEINVTGYTFNGSQEAIGFFQSEGPDFPLAQGIALSSGNVNRIVGGFGNLTNPYQNDSDLAVYQSAASLYDCVSLEINFIANESQLELAFIFASKEYSNYVCSNFNDIMGILLKPDTSDHYDIFSVVPFTSIPVTVNSLNGLGPQEFEFPFCDEANPDWEETYIYYVDNYPPSANGITIPGFTVPLIATMPLAIGDSYTLKIGICDTGDPYLDSTVLINSQSVNSTYDCPLLSANIGDPCEENLPGVAIITADCACTPVTQTPDIVVNASFDNSPYFSEDTIHVSVNTTNFSTSIYPNHEIKIYTSFEQEFNPASSTLQQTYLADELAALESIEFNFVITDFSYPFSSLPYYVIIDIPVAEGETMVVNNRAILSFYFEDNNYARVSLTPPFAEMTLQEDATSFDFSFNKTNPGPNYLTESDVNLYWSENQEYNESDILISEYQGNGMNIGATSTVNLSLDIPQPVSQNPYFVLVVPQLIEPDSTTNVDYAVARIEFNPLSAKSIDKTDWKAWFDENRNLVIQPGNDANGVYTFSLFDQLGREVLKRNSNSGIQTTATKGLSSGVYMLQIETGSQLISAKLALFQ